KKGDVLIGIASSGVHSNGYSLVRKIVFDKEKLSVKDKFDKTKTIGEVLLEPTRIYVKPVLDVLSKVNVKGMVHITGGGFYENIVRVLPENTCAVIKKSSFPILPIFSFLQEKGNVEEKEMYKTFNMGIGYILAVAKKDAEKTIEILTKHNEKAYLIGSVESGKREVKIL
ncbi:phosphoribosylformylglycinamidine cyclo-ligase, partial [bacterium]|nr:phosphoribosylformylglycinamidine cyclo-ligase [bacterium]